METSSNSDADALNTDTHLQFPVLRFLQSPISSLLEYSGVLRVQQPPPLHRHYSQNPSYLDAVNDGVSGSSNGNGNDGEVSIRIVGEQDRVGAGGEDDEEESMVDDVDDDHGGVVNDGVGGGNSSNGEGNREAAAAATSSPYQRYDIQQMARWVEQILPFSLLLLVVFIREHFQGFFVTTYITAILLKSNDILRKQTALKGERKISVLVGYSIIFILQVCGVYWWHRKDDLFNPLLMIPPKAIPPFWHAIFIILVNDTMVRQGAMVLKLVLLIYYKNGRGHSFRRQGQMLTLVEYTLLLYRALLPTPVWYRFFLNKEYGSLFSSLITGLYLTFKLTSSFEKIRFFFSALKALSRKEVHYGSHATLEQVNAAGDLCAICQEKMRSPILLCCKHIFCEDCVSEWFERERTCPLCRALVRPTDLRSYGDGSTNLVFQMG